MTEEDKEEIRQVNKAFSDEIRSCRNGALTAEIEAEIGGKLKFLRFLWPNCCVPKTPLELLVCSSKSFSLCSAKF